MTCLGVPHSAVRDRLSNKKPLNDGDKFPRSRERRVNVKDLRKVYVGDCKTVYPGSIPGVASNSA